VVECVINTTCLFAQITSKGKSDIMPIRCNYSNMNNNTVTHVGMIRFLTCEDISSCYKYRLPYSLSTAYLYWKAYYMSGVLD
jgi:hypothetical protein